jgi:hypothetical protein
VAEGGRFQHDVVALGEGLRLCGGLHIKLCRGPYDLSGFSPRWAYAGSLGRWIAARGELHPHAEPAGGTRCESEGSVVCLGDALDDCQAEADACMVGAYAFGAALKRLDKGGNQLWVELNDVDAIGKFGSSWPARQRAHGHARGDELVDERTADSAGGTGNENHDGPSVNRCVGACPRDSTASMRTMDTSTRQDGLVDIFHLRQDPVGNGRHR